MGRKRYQGDRASGWAGGGLGLGLECLPSGAGALGLSVLRPRRRSPVGTSWRLEVVREDPRPPSGHSNLLSRLTHGVRAVLVSLLHEWPLTLWCLPSLWGSLSSPERDTGHRLSLAL